MPVRKAQSYPTLRERQSGNSLLERSEEHDLLLPTYPTPAPFPILLSELIRLSSLLNDNEAHRCFIEAIQSEECVLRSVFNSATALATGSAGNSRNWRMERHVHSFLARKKPLCDQSLNCVLASTSNNSITSATRLLHALGELFVSKELANFIGTDGKGKSFETIQLAQLFATTRIPGIAKDKLRNFPASRHVIVWVRGRAFKVDILDLDRRVISKSVLRQQIQSIQERCRVLSEKRQNIASLSTCLSRSIWAERRTCLLERDQASLNVVESAISSIALEEYNNTTVEDELRLVHSDTGNVYSDKTMGFSIFPNGDIACRADHAAADGGVIGRVLQALSFALDKPLYLATASSFARARYFSGTITQRFLDLELGIAARFGLPATPVQEVHFDTLLSNCTEVPTRGLGFQKASRMFDLMQDSNLLLKLRVAKLLNFTVQMAFQIALFSTLDSTSIHVIEPTSTRNFAHGRTDPNSVVTKESIAFSKSLYKNSNEDLVSQFSAAYHRYKELLTTTKRGAGLGGSIASLREGFQQLHRSDAQDLVYQTLGKMCERTAMITGDPFCPSIDFVEAYVFAPNQIALAYMGRQDSVRVSISGSGNFCPLVNALQRSLQKNFSRVVSVALASNTA